MTRMICHILFALSLATAVGLSFADDKPTTGPVTREKTHPQLTASQRCITCHKDPHAGELGTDCQQCHSFPAPWKRPWELFDHAAQTRYPLAGGHAGLQCADCHSERGEDPDRSEAKIPILRDPSGKDKSFRRVKKNCADCHDDVARFYRGTSHFPASTGRDEITTTPSEMFSLVRCEDCHANDASRTSLTQIQPECARCHNADYAALAAYWRGELFIQTDALIAETKSLEQRINEALIGAKRRSRPFGSGRSSEPLPTDLQISLREAQKNLRSLEQSLKDLRRTGIHNLPLLHRELLQTKRELRKMTQLLTRN